MKPREPRRNVLIQARMRRDGSWGDVCLRNLSSRGMLVQAAAAPPRGTYVEIFWGSHVVIGRVAWTNERRFGIRTQDRMDVGAIIAEHEGARSARVTKSAARLSGERRSAAREMTAANVAQRLERSRRISAMLEFGCVVALGVAAATIMVSVVRETLGRPLEVISSRLDG